MFKFGPIYDPPYDSHLENRFAWSVVKYLHPLTRLDKQVSIQTICGQFRLDFLIELIPFKVGVECDGKQFHNEERDRWRDAMILGAGAADVIYRLPGRSLNMMEDCLYGMAHWNQEIFSERGRINLRQLASREARSQVPGWKRHDTEGVIGYEPDLGDECLKPSFVVIERRVRSFSLDKPELWQVLYEYAREQGGGNLDDLIERFNANTRSD